MLLAAGAYPDQAVNALQETALYIACEYGHEDVVETLIQAGADMENSSRRNGTALQVASKFGHKSIVAKLLAAGANTDPAGYHMDSLIRANPRSAFGNAITPTLPRYWTIDLLSKEAEDLNLVQIHDNSMSSVVTCTNFSVDGRHLVAGGRWSAWTYDLANTGQASELKHIEARNSDLRVRSTCFSPDGGLVLTGGEDFRVCLWESETKVVKLIVEEHEKEMYAVAFSPDSTMIASASACGSVLIYNCNTGDVVQNLGYDISIISLAFSPDCSLMAFGDLDGLIRMLWIDTQDKGYWGTNELADGGHEDTVLCVGFSMNGDQLLSASVDKTVKCRRMENRKTQWVRTLVGHEDFVLSVAETGDSRFIVTGSRDKTIRLRDCETGEPQAAIKGHQNSVISVATCPTENLIATAWIDATLTVWQYD